MMCMWTELKAPGAHYHCVKSHFWPEEADHLSDVKVLVCTQHVSCNLLTQKENPHSFGSKRINLQSKTKWIWAVVWLDIPRHRQTDSSYHYDVVLQLAAAYGQLHVSHGPKTVLQCSAAVVDHIFHWEVIGCGPALIVLIPGQCNRRRREREKNKSCFGKNL